jgi:hypothetical protein
MVHAPHAVQIHSRGIYTSDPLTFGKVCPRSVVPLSFLLQAW